MINHVVYQKVIVTWDTLYAITRHFPTGMFQINVGKNEISKYLTNYRNPSSISYTIHAIFDWISSGEKILNENIIFSCMLTTTEDIN